MRLIPTEEDWGDWRADLDQEYAHDLYIGKSNEEMVERYLIGPIEVFSELRFIEKIPFQYYVIGFRDSVLSKKHLDSISMGAAASCFIDLLVNRAERDITAILEIENEVMSAAKYIAENQAAFSADESDYGNFKVIVEKLEKLIAQSKLK